MNVIESLKKYKFISILRNASPEYSADVIKALYGNTVVAGAGTVITMEFAWAAYDAGAKFLVSPCTSKNKYILTGQNKPRRQVIWQQMRNRANLHKICMDLIFCCPIYTAKGFSRFLFL